jgi:hypothetical protein
MRINLKIANIKIDYTFHSFDYLKDRIYAFEDTTKGSSDYTIEVKIEEQIIPFAGQNQQIINGRSYFQSKRLDVFEVFSDDDMPISEQIIFDKAKHKVTIYINPIDVLDIAKKEYILSGMMFLEIAQREGIIPLFTSAIDYKGDALLFADTAKHEKSAHAKMWRQTYGQDVHVIDENKPLVFKEGERFMISSTPFSSQKHHHNLKMPLKAIIFIEQSTHDEIIKLSPTESLIRIINHILKPRDEDVWNTLLYVINELISEIPIYLLKSTKSLSSIDVTYEKLYGQNGS